MGVAHVSRHSTAIFRPRQYWGWQYLVLHVSSLPATLRGLRVPSTVRHPRSGCAGWPTAFAEIA